ncbi:hypothetical protein K431DRAFT_232917, partial [Polychaeton citri CBS 116435]
NSALRSSYGAKTPVLKFGIKVTAGLESAYAQIVVQKRKIQDLEDIVESYKKRPRGKQVVLKGIHLLIVDVVIQAVEKVEENSATKRKAKRKLQRTATRVEQDADQDIDYTQFHFYDPDASM